MTDLIDVTKLKELIDQNIERYHKQIKEFEEADNDENLPKQNYCQGRLDSFLHVISMIDRFTAEVSS